MDASATAPSSDALARRLARLEDENRRLRWAVVAALLGATCALVVAVRAGEPATAHTLVASRFVVRDPEGRERAVLGFDHPSSPRHSPVRVALYNPDDGAHWVAWVSGGFAGSSASARGGEGGTLRVEAFANPREGVGVRLGGTGRRAAATLRAAAGAGTLALEDATGRVTFRAP